MLLPFGIFRKKRHIDTLTLAFAENDHQCLFFCKFLKSLHRLLPALLVIVQVWIFSQKDRQAGGWVCGWGLGRNFGLGSRRADWSVVADMDNWQSWRGSTATCSHCNGQKYVWIYQYWYFNQIKYNCVTISWQFRESYFRRVYSNATAKDSVKLCKICW